MSILENKIKSLKCKVTKTENKLKKVAKENQELRGSLEMNSYFVDISLSNKKKTKKIKKLKANNTFLIISMSIIAVLIYFIK